MADIITCTPFGDYIGLILRLWDMQYGGSKFVISHWNGHPQWALL